MSMHKEKKGKHFIKQAVYKGGMKAMKAFIKEQLRYPKKALSEKIEGSVYLKYTVNHKGKVIDTKVISSLGYGCDEEAVRIVKMLEFEVPKNRGVKVLYHKNIQIHFRLPKKKAGPKTPPPTQTNSASAQAMQIRYHITPTKGKNEDDKDGKTGYTYTI